MSLRIKHILAASLACAPFLLSMPVIADSNSPAAIETPAKGQPPMACLQPGDSKFNTAQVTADCCKDRKGVCGCRAGKIVCCDAKPSTVTGCTCHGEEGLLQ
jgi:hypothetical protein